MTLPTMKAGDRVRLTLEGEVCSTVVGHEIAFKLDGAVFATTKLATTELTAPTARVEVLPPPIEVGDMVRVSDGRGQPRRVLHVHDGRAWIEQSCQGDYPVQSVRDLTLVSKASKAGGRV